MREGEVGGSGDAEQQAEPLARLQTLVPSRVEHRGPGQVGVECDEETEPNGPSKGPVVPSLPGLPRLPDREQWVLRFQKKEKNNHHENAHFNRLKSVSRVVYRSSLLWMLRLGKQTHVQSVSDRLHPIPIPCLASWENPENCESACSHV